MVSFARRETRQDIDDEPCGNTDLLAGMSLQLTKQPPLLMHQQIHHLLSP
jgi:hypothetical protein